VGMTGFLQSADKTLNEMKTVMMKYKNSVQ